MKQGKKTVMAFWILTAIAALAGSATTVTVNTVIAAVDAAGANIGLNIRRNK